MEVWVRLEEELDDQAHLVSVSRAGFVAHLLRAVSATLNIDEKDIQGLSLNNTVRLEPELEFS